MAVVIRPNATANFYSRVGRQLKIHLNKGATVYFYNCAFTFLEIVGNGLVVFYDTYVWFFLAHKAKLIMNDSMIQSGIVDAGHVSLHNTCFLRLQGRRTEFSGTAFVGNFAVNGDCDTSKLAACTLPSDCKARNGQLSC